MKGFPYPSKIGPKEYKQIWETKSRRWEINKGPNLFLETLYTIGGLEMHLYKLLVQLLLLARRFG